MKLVSLGNTPSPHVLIIPLYDRGEPTPYTLNYETYADARERCTAPTETKGEHYRDLERTEIGLRRASEDNLESNEPLLFELSRKSDMPLREEEISALQTIIEAHNLKVAGMAQSHADVPISTSMYSGRNIHGSEMTPPSG